MNNDIHQRVVIKPEEYSWTASSRPGVEQMTFDRIGGDPVQSTSLVRYASRSELAPNLPNRGTEILVLEGTFSDDQREYSAGTYVRIPGGGFPRGRVGTQGCTLFIKSYQFSQKDKHLMAINTQQTPWRPGIADGLQVMPLYEHESEHVALVRWTPHTQFTYHSHQGGEEILVLEGVFYDEYGRYPTGTWIRSPHLSTHTPFTKEEGALIYVKIGHLIPGFI